MAEAPNYRFSFQITDETTGDNMVVDLTSFSAESVHPDGGCEAVDHQVAAGMRAFRRLYAKHEAENYPNNDEQLVTQTAGKIRTAVEG